MKKIQVIRNLFKKKNGVLTTKDLQSIGLTKYAINNLLKNGTIERIKRGKYIHNEVEEDELFLIQQIIPKGVFCLLSAAAIYNLTTHVPNKYHLGIKSNLHPKLPNHPPIKIYYWRKKQYDLGLVSIQNNGSIIRIYDKEKTVCDFIKFRSKMETNVVNEVIKTYLKDEEKNLEKLKKYSKELKIESILNNYFEILL